MYCNRNVSSLFEWSIDWLNKIKHFCKCCRHKWSHWLIDWLIWYRFSVGKFYQNEKEIKFCLSVYLHPNGWWCRTASGHWTGHPWTAPWSSSNLPPRCKSDPPGKSCTSSHTAATICETSNPVAVCPVPTRIPGPAMPLGRMECVPGAGPTSAECNSDTESQET